MDEADKSNSISSFTSFYFKKLHWKLKNIVYSSFFRTSPVTKATSVFACAHGGELRMIGIICCRLLILWTLSKWGTADDLGPLFFIFMPLSGNFGQITYNLQIPDLGCGYPTFPTDQNCLDYMWLFGNFGVNVCSPYPHPHPPPPPGRLWRIPHPPLIWVISQINWTFARVFSGTQKICLICWNVNFIMFLYRYWTVGTLFWRQDLYSEHDWGHVGWF